MKKLLMAVLAGVMLIGYTSTAVAEITISGEIETRYALWNNLTLNHAVGYADWSVDREEYVPSAKLSGTQTFWDSNITLSIDAQIAEGLSAFIQLHQDNTPWGNTSNPKQFASHYVNGDDYYFADPGPFTSEDRKDPRNNGIGIRQAWINFMIPGLPVGMKIGHQPLALGHGIWLDVSRYGADAILMYSMPVPELLLAGAYVKGLEASPVTPLNGNTSLWKHAAGPNAWAQPESGSKTHGAINGSGSDCDFYALLANYTWMEGNTVGMNITYAHDNSDWIRKFFNGSFGPDLNSFSGDQLGTTNIRAANIMLTLDGAIAGLSYKGEFDYLHVTVDNFGNTLIPGNGHYVVTAWAAMLGLNYNVAGIVDLGLEGAFGTGNRMGDPGIIYGVLDGPSFGTIFDDITHRQGRHDHAYATPYEISNYYYSYIYNDKVGQGPMGVGGGKGFGDGYGGFGIANTTYLKLSMDFAPMEHLTAGLDVLWLRASNSIIRGQSRSLGWEVDAQIGYEIYDNLSLEVLGGYFFTGPFYAYNGYNDLVTYNPVSDTLGSVSFPEEWTDNGEEAGSNLKKDDAYGAEVRLKVTF